MRLLQLCSKTGGRRVGMVEDPHIRLLDTHLSVYHLAQAAIARGCSLAAMARQSASPELLDYDGIYAGTSDWRILPPVDHPEEPCRCLVTGTGLTHLKSASQRNAMHAAAASGAVTDSLRMYQWGVEGGRPGAGRAGTAPEWFYKGTGRLLRAHGEPLRIPSHAEGDGEEAEIASVYLITPAGRPVRLGLAQGNEFSDHRFEQRNYLYLAASKLRTCSIGPELVLDADFRRVPGAVKIERHGEVRWSRQIASGDEAMCHTLANIEHHHFKFEPHRHPGDVHIHFLGADAFSFNDGVELADGDVMEIDFEGFGRPLRNPVCIDHAAQGVVSVSPL